MEHVLKTVWGSPYKLDQVLPRWSHEQSEISIQIRMKFFICIFSLTCSPGRVTDDTKVGSWPLRKTTFSDYSSHTHLAGLAERALAISDSRSAVPDSILKIARHLVLVGRSLPPIIATGNCQSPACPQLARPQNVATELRIFLMLIPSKRLIFSEWLWLKCEYYLNPRAIPPPGPKRRKQVQKAKVPVKL